MHALKRGVDNQGCHKLVYVYGKVLGYKPHVLKFLEVVIFLSSASSSSLGSLSWFKEFLSHALIRVWKNSQTLWQHMKNDHKERRNVGQNVRFSKRQS